MRQIETYSDIFQLCVTLAFQNCVIFRTLAYLELKTSSKTCQTCKNSIFRAQVSLFKDSLFKHLEIFRNIDPYSVTIHFKRIVNLCHVLHRAHSGFCHIWNSVYSGIYGIVRTTYSIQALCSRIQALFRTLCNPCICSNLDCWQSWNIKNPSTRRFI